MLCTWIIVTRYCKQSNERLAYSYKIDSNGSLKFSNIRISWCVVTIPRARVWKIITFQERKTYIEEQFLNFKSGVAVKKIHIRY